VPVTENTSNDSGGNGKPTGGGKANGNGAPGNEGGKPANDGVSSTATVKFQVDQPSGSSGIGAVLGQATGSADNGSLGLWLPVAIIAAIAGSIAYLVRTRPGRTV
jgi:hypothetical protein